MVLIEEKKCYKCEVVKPLHEFNKYAKSRDGKGPHCRLCQSLYRTKYYHAHRDKLRSDSANYYLQNKERVQKQSAIYFRNNREKARLAGLKRREDPLVRLRLHLRNRIWNGLKGRDKKTSITKSVGCSSEELRRYLESQFEPGMGWVNYGTGKGKWHVDHIVPLSVFDLSDEHALYVANNYMNLRPMWGSENIRKGASLTKLFKGQEEPMGSFNYAIIVGRLGKDPEVRSTPNGALVASFSVASDFGFGKNAGTLWDNVVAWQEQAKFAQSHLKKGSMIRLIGERTTRKYTGKDQQEKTINEVRALDISFFSESKERVANSNGEGRSSSAPTARTQAAPAVREQAAPVARATDLSAELEITDLDLPF